MDGIELTSRRGFGSRAYDELPQQDHGLHSAISPSYDQSSGPMSPNDKRQYSQSMSQLTSIPSIMVSPEPYRLPPKAYYQSSKERRIWTHVTWATAFIVGLALPLTVLMPTIYYQGDDYTSGTTYCTSIDGADPGASIGDSFSAILNISVAYGNLSFGVAKFIDLVWDVFISRGGQIGLGYVAYRVHTSALLGIMEDKLVSYDLFATMTLSWATVWGLRPIFKTFFANLGFKRKLLLFWVAISIVWVAIWPTITVGCLQASSSYFSSFGSYETLLNSQKILTSL